MILMYKLDSDMNPVLCEFDDYVSFLNNKENVIQQTEINGYKISTVFLGLVAFFETSVYCGDSVVWSARSNEFQKSIDFHDIACKMVKDKRNVDLWTKHLL
jgi:hypothetical protein